MLMRLHAGVTLPDLQSPRILYSSTSLFWHVCGSTPLNRWSALVLGLHTVAASGVFLDVRFLNLWQCVFVGPGRFFREPRHCKGLAQFTGAASATGQTVRLLLPKFISTAVSCQGLPTPFRKTRSYAASLPLGCTSHSPAHRNQLCSNHVFTGWLGEGMSNIAVFGS
jgi:hypothetical protein